jgi:hypothetical protein
MSSKGLGVARAFLFPCRLLFFAIRLFTLKLGNVFNLVE